MTTKVVADDVLGKMTRRWHEVLERARKGKIDPNLILSGLQRMIDGGWGSGNPVFRLIVDYDQPLSEAVKAGKYDWVNGDITPEHFPQTRQGKEEVVVELLHFSRFISSEDALAEIEMKKQGFRPAVIEELLALGAAQPELQRQFPVVALGSVLSRPDGLRSVLYLYGDGSRRSLDLDDLGGAWGGGWRFAVVRE